VALNGAALGGARGMRLIGIVMSAAWRKINKRRKSALGGASLKRHRIIAASASAAFVA